MNAPIVVCAYDGEADHTSCLHLDLVGVERDLPPVDAISCAFCLRVGHWAPACPREFNVVPA